MLGEGEVMSDVPVLVKRRLQAEVVGPIFEAMVAEIGRERAEAVLGAAIRKAAVAEGAAFRARVPEGAGTMAAFVELFGLWTRGGALEIEVLEASDDRFDFNVTRCRYAEMYREMGLDTGHLLSCNRDGTFAEGFDPALKLDRAQTIMGGAPCCTFRYRLAP
jgi:L-2-amino-thiazoline-4-carboxylic acid hydrolase-like protein